MANADDPRRGHRETEPTAIFLGGDDDAGDSANAAPGTDDTASDQDAAGDAADDAGEQGNNFSIPQGHRLYGKTPAQIIEEFDSLHSEFGRQARELGESRDVLRTAVMERLQRQSPPQEEADVTPEEFETNPKQAVSKLVQSALKEALDPVLGQLQQVKTKTDVSSLAAKHPDYQQVGSSPEFHAWIKESPYRTKTFNKAHREYDMEAADDLLTEFKAVRAARSAPTKQTQQVRENASISGGGSTGGSRPRGKIYRALDIQREYLKDPELYAANEAEYAKAFAEGRVR